ncbi:hypothetical protein [uncultured Gilvimarinus sp.]|uniref:hypothetical protein n=1 Tax=uncultured Gilvimarinus sp. TaxID=1689143 RepID=UPI0030EB3F9B|tara:strand:- start:3361 stop:3600 length:240 start_codon:yes stop_codon:yes gene_type:complete
MVYLGPITRLTPVSKPKPATGYEPDRDILVSKQLPEHQPRVVDRRRGDRRKERGDALLDTRSGKDRRRSQPRPKIDIEV